MSKPDEASKICQQTRHKYQRKLARPAMRTKKVLTREAGPLVEYPTGGREQTNVNKQRIGFKNKKPIK